MNTDDADSLSTRDRIFLVAVKLFSDEGYQEVSMRDIANVVGIKVSSLYNHFASKRELLNTRFFSRIMCMNGPAAFLSRC